MRHWLLRWPGMEVQVGVDRPGRQFWSQASSRLSMSMGTCQKQSLA